MKVYVLCSYGDSLNDPSISTDYQEIYEKMEKSYKMVLEDVYQTEEEKEYIEIYKDVIRLNKELHGYLSYLHSVKTVKYYITQNTGIVRPVDTSYVRRLATASRGRWKIALATASGL